LDRFWDSCLQSSRSEVSWSKVLQLLVTHRLIDPGGKFRLHRQWFDRSAILEKLATLDMVDVWLPTTDGRWLIMPRFTQPEAEHKIILDRLKLRLPNQPLPRIHSGQLPMVLSVKSVDL
jgi:hypothetical protein